EVITPVAETAVRAFWLVWVAERSIQAGSRSGAGEGRLTACGGDHDRVMRYENVSIAVVVQVDAPVRLSSADLMVRLSSTVERLQLLPRPAGGRRRHPRALALGSSYAGRRGRGARRRTGA